MLLMTLACQKNGVVSTTQAGVMGSSQALHVIYLNVLRRLWKEGGVILSVFDQRYLHASMHVKIVQIRFLSLTWTVTAFHCELLSGEWNVQRLQEAACDYSGLTVS